MRIHVACTVVIGAMVEIKHTKKINKSNRTSSSRISRTLPTEGKPIKATLASPDFITSKPSP